MRSSSTGTARLGPSDSEHPGGEGGAATPPPPNVHGACLAGVTCHSVRGTFASLAYAGGGTPAEVMDAMGHTDPSLALAIYAKVVTRRGGIGARIDTAMRDTDLADGTLVRPGLEHVGEDPQPRRGQVRIPSRCAHAISALNEPRVVCYGKAYGP